MNKLIHINSKKDIGRVEQLLKSNNIDFTTGWAYSFMLEKEIAVRLENLLEGEGITDEQYEEIFECCYDRLMDAEIIDDEYVIAIICHVINDILDNKKTGVI